METIEHSALEPGRSAVITGGASGIGLSVAIRLAKAGMRICIADRGDALAAAADTIRAAGSPDVLAAEIDVAKADDLLRLRDDAFSRFGEVGLLMNNAGISGNGHPYSNPETWELMLRVNLFGVINGVQAFTQAMIDQKLPAVIVNTGSKQGITCPPGNIAYNVSKAGIKALTEGLEHSLRNVEDRRVSAHLLIPGFTYTGMIARRLPEKPAFAWTSEQVVEVLIDGIVAGDFYILCPDNETPRSLDERRILWGAGDIVENRPALSRWHPDYKEAFEAFVRAG